MPTVSRRLPAPLAPGARPGCPAAASRTSISRRPSRRGALGEQRMVGEPGVHAADEVEPGVERLDQGRQPVRRDHAAAIGDADHQRARAARRGLGRGQSGRPVVTVALGRAYSPTHLSGRPVAQAEGGLGIAGVGRIAEEQQIGRGQVERPRASLPRKLAGSGDRATHHFRQMEAEASLARPAASIIEAERQPDRPRPDPRRRRQRDIVAADHRRNVVG